MNEEFPFSDSQNTATFTCTHVLNHEKPITLASHDEDGYWQFLCDSESHSDEESKVVGLGEIYAIDKTIAKLANLDYGHIAYRDKQNSEWTIE